MTPGTYIEKGEDALATHNLKEILTVGLQMVWGTSYLKTRRGGHRHAKYHGLPVLHDPVLMYQLFGGDLCTEGVWV